MGPLYNTGRCATSHGAPGRDWVERHPFEVDEGLDGTAPFIAVSPEYFRIMGMQITRGREFAESDVRRPVAVVNEVFARRFRPRGDIVGAHIRTELGGVAQSLQIIGVVAEQDRAPATPSLVWIPFALQPRSEFSLLVLSDSRDASMLASGVRSAMQSLDRNVPLAGVETYSRIRDRQFAVPRVLAGMTGAFGALALLLATIGAYGLMSYTVAQRTHEIGVRSALGASGRDVLWLIMRSTCFITLFGTVAGLIGTVALARLLRGLLFGIPAQDYFIAVGVASLLAATTLLASYVPARKAASIAPLEALRAE